MSTEEDGSEERLTQEDLVKAVQQVYEQKRRDKRRRNSRKNSCPTPVSSSEASSSEATSETEDERTTRSSGSSDGSDAMSDVIIEADDTPKKTKKPDTLGRKPTFVVKNLKILLEKFTLSNPFHQNNRDLVYSGNQVAEVLAIAHAQMRRPDEGAATENLESMVSCMVDAMVICLDQTVTEEEMERRFACMREYGPKNTPIHSLVKGQLKEFVSIWVRAIFDDPAGTTPGYVAKATRDLAIFAGCRDQLDAVSVAINQKFKKMGGTKYGALGIHVIVVIKDKCENIGLRLYFM